MRPFILVYTYEYSVSTHHDMREQIKNFFAVVFATTVWCLGVSVIVWVFLAFDSGWSRDEFIVLALLVALFCSSLSVSRFNKRLEVALTYPFMLLP
jgi:hypothetical protein